MQLVKLEYKGNLENSHYSKNYKGQHLWDCTSSIKSLDTSWMLEKTPKELPLIILSSTKYLQI